MEMRSIDLWKEPRSRYPALGAAAQEMGRPAALQAHGKGGGTMTSKRHERRKEQLQCCTRRAAHLDVLARSQTRASTSLGSPERLKNLRVGTACDARCLTYTAQPDCYN